MSLDGDAHETRRNVLLAVGLSVVAVILVGGMFWVMSSLSRSAVTGSATVGKTTTGTDSASVAPFPTSSTVSDLPPAVGTWTNTATLPPGEQPTMTVPVPGQTVDPVPGAAPSARTAVTPPTAVRTTATPVQPPAPTTVPPAPSPVAPSPVAPSPVSTAPAAPSVTNVSLACSKANGSGSGSGKQITATLSFTTTTRVDVLLAPGGSGQRSQAGPGNVSLTASARGADLCYAQVAGRIVGPVPAS